MDASTRHYSTRAPVTRPWQAALIIGIVLLAVTGAAAAGWWYARESPPHQGPIVLISVDGLRQDRLSAYGATGAETPAIDALSADGVVFERAYTHSPLLLPAHASMLAGQLPFEHGVRDEAGFVLREEARPMAELLRSRGFATGAAVSSFLLRRESGVAQGFSFFDADFPAPTLEEAPVTGRTGDLTAEAAERWVRTQDDQRFFLFIQVDGSGADAAVSRIVQQLKDRDLYDEATIVLTADRGDDAVFSLDEASLRVPLIVKQPDSQGAGRRVASLVQHIDLLPTVLDLVRAPIPSSLTGRSLRNVLDNDDARITDQPIYSESLAARFRIGGHPLFALTGRGFRIIRGAGESVSEIGPAEAAPATEGVAEMRAMLDRLLEGRAVAQPSEIPPADEAEYAAFGYLGGGVVAVSGRELDPDTGMDERELIETHREAAMLAAQKRYAPAIDRLRTIVRSHPSLAVVRYQLGTLLVRAGRFDDAVAAFRDLAVLQPDNPYVPIAIARTLMSRGRLDEAVVQAALAVALAEHRDSRARLRAHEVSARIAAALANAEQALEHAAAVEAEDASLPLGAFIRGRLLYDEGNFEDALMAFEEAADALREQGRVLEDLHVSLGDTLVQLERQAEAETRFRDELASFPRSLHAYASLATLYYETDRRPALDELMTQLLEAVPTAEGYATAARLWTAVGDRDRALALRADARTRFRGDPALAILERTR